MKCHCFFSPIIILVTIALNLSSCSPGVYSKQNKVTDPTRRYENDRLSFLPPAGDGWYGITKEKSGMIDFYAGVFTSREGDRNHHIAIIPFVDAMDANDWDGVLKRRIKAVDGFNANYNNAAGAPDRPYQKLSIVKKAGMRCIAREDFTPASKTRGKGGGVDYTCEAPNQQKELPLLWIVYGETAVPGVPFIGADAVMEPIWRSLQFKTVDLANSAQYQRWKIGNAKSRAEDAELKIRYEKIAAQKRNTQQQQ